jgi:hypothetical protein
MEVPCWPRILAHHRPCVTNCRFADAQNARAGLLKLAPDSAHATREGVDAFSALVNQISACRQTKEMIDAQARAPPGT